MKMPMNGASGRAGRVAVSRTAALLMAALLQACGGGSGSAEPVRTIRGQVVNETGAGLGWLEVRATRAGGWSAPARTANDGAFTLDGIGSTYDLAVLEPSSALVLVGLTRSDPTVTWRFSSSTPFTRPAATVSGQVTGDCGGLCPPAGQGGAYLGAFSVTDDSPMATWSGVLPGEVASSVPTPGPGSVSGRLHALYWTCDLLCGQESIPTGFWYARSDAVSVTAGEVRQVALPPLAPVPSASLLVDLVRPAGLTTDRTLIYVTPWFGPGTTEHVVWDQGAPWGTAAFTVPDVAELELSVGVWASNGAGLEEAFATEHHLPPGTARAAPVLRDGPVLTAPAAGAAIGPGTRFTWTHAEGVAELQVGYSGSGFLRVVTARRDATWPELAPFWRSAYLPGAPLQWQVTASGTAATVDEVAAPTGRGRRSSWWSISAIRPATAR